MAAIPAATSASISTPVSAVVFTFEAIATPFSDRKSTRLNSSHSQISYAVFCLKKIKCCHTVRKRRNHRLLLVDAEAAARALATRIAAVLLRQLRKVGIGDCRQDRFGFLAHRIL